jgi:hypothetical protein
MIILHCIAVCPLESQNTSSHSSTYSYNLDSTHDVGINVIAHTRLVIYVYSHDTKYNVTYAPR